jgi:hypothetical protein
MHGIEQGGAMNVKNDISDVNLAVRDLLQFQSK